MDGRKVTLDKTGVVLREVRSKPPDTRRKPFISAEVAIRKGFQYMEHEVLTVRQAAEHVQVSTDTVYRLVSSGELPAKKVGRIWRLHCSAIQTFLMSSTKPVPGFQKDVVCT